MSILNSIIEYINGAQTSAAYRPTTPYTGSLPTKTVKKGSKGTSVKNLQNFLNWCIKAGLAKDGKAGSKTVKAIKKFQSAYGLKADGVFGSKSRAKAKAIVNSFAPAPAPTPAPAPAPPAPAPASSIGASIAAAARNYAWAYGTKSSKYTYPKGSAKSAYKSALKKHMGKKAKISQTDCGYFVSTCVRSVLGNKFLALPSSYKKKYPKVPSNMYIAQKGGASNLQPGDVIRYRKSGGQHTVLYLGDGYIAHASRKHAFPRIAKAKPWNNSNVKKSTIQVIRAK